MNKKRKQYILESIQTMYEAHSYIEKYYNECQSVQLEEMLADCQGMAISIGNSIEESEENAFGIIEPFEVYCEELYQILLNYNSNIISPKIKKKLDKKLIAAENRVRNDIVAKTEVVFMPYKASMWDSLESIWKAASEDVECETYVVPIPYYDRNPDFSLGSYNYEGSLFPEYVPITDYKVFDLEVRKPDVIYIHNPYDDCNYVTSVEPNYYSWELKKHTDCLVYVPYCVYGEYENISNEAMIQWYSKYISFPIMRNADKIILQSEKIKELFVNIATTNLGENKKFWERKFSALGSPKYDKILSAENKNKNYPQIWDKILQQDNGVEKIIVFYNTSLSSLLAYNERMIEKIKSVIKFFQKNREKYILLWRPHPLAESTLQAMNPLIFNKYKALVNSFKQGNYGIYDDSPEYICAFNISDIYYGDYSSLVPLYQKSNKMLLLQNPDILSYDLRLVSEKIYIYKNKVWMTSRDFNGLFSWDIDSKEFEFIGSFEREEKEGYQLYYGMVGVGDKLYFCPYNAKNIGVYDITNDEFSYIQLDKDIREEQRKFIGILNIGEEVFLMGRNLPFIAKVNTLTNKFERIVNLNKDARCLDKNSISVYIPSSYVSEDKIYYFHSMIHSIVCYDSKNDKTGVIYKNDNLSGRMFLEEENEKIWIFEKPSGKISIFDKQLNTIVQVCVIDNLSSFCRNDQYVYCFSFVHPIMYRINCETKEIKEINIGAIIYDSYVKDNTIYMLDYLNGNLYTFNTQEERLNKFELKLDKDLISRFDLLEAFQKNKDSNGRVEETSYLNISTLLEEKPYKESIQKDKRRENYGEKIYSYIKGEGKK